MAGTWMIIPVKSTTSAQRRASSRSGSVFSSTTRNSQPAGSSGARLNRPRGGREAALPAIGRLCWKPQ